VKRFASTLILALLFLPGFARALDTSTRLVGPVREWSAADLERSDPSWLHVKFVEGSEVVLGAGQFLDRRGGDVSKVNRILASAPVTEIRRTFDHDRSLLQVWKAAGEARSGQIGPDLSLWFDLRVDGGPGELARVLNELNACRMVEIAHPAPMVETASLTFPSTARPAGDPTRSPDFTSQQGYLYSAPTGLDAPMAWAVSGGTGLDMKFIDVELGWTTNHEDFNVSNLFYHGSAVEDPGSEPHGTAVLGEILAQPNAYGVSGFAPDIRFGVVPITIPEWPNVPHYFQDAVDHLDTGDVWLIELQMYPPGFGATPMEWLQVNYDVIWTSVWARGIICVEAGANGSQNLDSPNWGGLFDRNLRDSGAIMVGAGDPHTLAALYFSNYGTRMDVHAWGSEIVTTGYGDLYNGGTLQTRYTNQFGGTSGASPMIAGAVLCLQGIIKANLMTVADPITLRRFLRDTGTPQTGAHLIGPRPNLAAAIPAALDLAAAPEISPVAEPALSVAPNPFRTGTEVRFTLPQSAQARLVVYDLGGRRVRTLLDGAAVSGEGSVLWDGRDDAGRSLGGGVYVSKLEAGPYRASRLIIRIR
jgi:serine protease